MTTALPSALRPRRLSTSGLILAVVCVAQFMVVLDVSIVNVALPAIRHDLHLSESGLQWVLNAYTLTFAGFLLLGGRAADLYGRRRLFLSGLLLFSGMSLLGGFAHSGGQLIAARAAQGLGGAVLSPATLTILTTTFTEPKARARALGLWSAVAGAGGATGVLAGGVLTDLLSWRWILFINVPIGIVTAAVARFAVHESRVEGERPTLDWLGALTVTAGLTTVVYAIVSIDRHPLGSSTTLVTLAVGVLLLIAFGFVETRHPHPLVPLRLFRNRAVTGANLIMLLVGSVMFALFFFLSQYLQDVQNYSPLQAGFAFVPMPIAIIVGTQLSSRLVHRFGARRLLVVGESVAVVGLLLLSRLQVGSGYLLHIAVPGVLITFGVGMGFVPLTLSATTGVARHDAGLASGLINTTRQVGGSLGLAVLATAATTRAHEVVSAGRDFAATAGYARAYALSAGLLALAVVIAWLVLPRHVGPAPTATPIEDLGAAGMPVLETA